MTCGIYEIICLPTGKRYVGSALRTALRARIHFSALSNRKHGNRYLQNAWNKHGRDCFEFRVVEVCSGEGELLEREQFWIEHYRSAESKYGFNIAYPVRQRLPSKRMSRRHKEYWKSLTEDELKQRLSYQQDPAFIAKIKAIRADPEYRKRVSDKAKKRWSDPKFKSKTKKKFRKFWNDPSKRAGAVEQRVDTANKLWTDPSHRAAMSKVRADRWRDPEYARERQEGTKKLWEDPAYRAKTVNKIKIACNRPEYIAALKKRVTECWAKRRQERIQVPAS